MKDWKTTAAGAVSAFFSFVLFAPQHFGTVPILHDIAAFVLSGGLLFLGLSANDYRKKP